MGVYIFMDILPHQIDKRKWEKVYHESLQLIRAYPFMDSTVDRESYGVPWKYVQRTDEEEMEIGYKDSYLGWHVFGDNDTMLAAESFSLIRNIDRYRYTKNVNGGSEDILVELINHDLYFNQKDLQIPVNSVRVFDGKTQGFPHHTYLLAIACLIESRFPKQALVWGDISIAQMKKAIEWANTILQKPIQLTERTDNERLLHRMKDIVQDNNEALKALMSLTMHKEDVNLGEFIRRKFNSEVITAYFTEQFKKYSVNTMGFRSSLSTYFNLGFSIEDACEICVLDTNGCRYDGKDFVETVMSMNWNSEESNEIPLTFNEPDSEHQETVYSQFGKTMLQMAGFQETIQSSLSYEDVVAILQFKLGKIIDINPLLQREKDKNDKVDDLLNEFLSSVAVEKHEEESEIPTYTISDPDYLILWEKDDSLHPDLEKVIKKLKEFITSFIENNNDLLDEFHSYTKQEKVQILIKANRFFYIKKDTWDYYIQNINQVNIINAFYSLLNVQAEEVDINTLCKAVANNVGFLKKYIL